MFSESGEFYDLLYGSLKDYASEAAKIAGLIRDRRSGARTVLDVGCGTGQHAKALADRHSFEVDGLDLDPVFVRMAQERNPHGTFSTGDMTAFDLGRRYDALVCLFSSIGYVRTLQNLRRAFDCFVRHLHDGGVLIVEPWFTPSAWQPGRVDINIAEENGTKVARMSRSSQEGRISIVEFEYLIGRAEGIEHRREVHEIGLFESDEMLSALGERGFRTEYDPEGLMGRGLYVAQLG